MIKPSERVPLTLQKVFELVEAVGLPPGVLNLVNGGRDVVNALIDHPNCGPSALWDSSAVAGQVTRERPLRASVRQCQGGAKNPVVVCPMPISLPVQT